MAENSHVRNPFIVTGAVLGGTGIFLDALLSHILGPDFSEKAVLLFEQAIEYQLYHALALILCGLLARLENTVSVRVSGYLFMVGVSLFCGGLYLYALLEHPQIKVAIPIGGVMLVVGWMTLALSFIGHTRRKGMKGMDRTR